MAHFAKLRSNSKVIQVLPLDNKDKQKLLELSDIELRLDVLCQIMDSELKVETDLMNFKQIIPTNINSEINFGILLNDESLTGNKTVNLSDNAFVTLNTNINKDSYLNKLFNKHYPNRNLKIFNYKVIHDAFMKSF